MQKAPANRSIADMTGMTVVITGAGSGLGLETAVALAAMGASLVLIEVDPQRAKSAAERVADAGPTPLLLIADLSEQAGVRRVAGEIRAAVPAIHVLVNNVGAMFAERRVTSDGIEATFALNHIAAFTLTNLLLDRIIGSAPARIVTVSSGAHLRVKAEDALDMQSVKEFSPFGAYDRSKLANILFTRSIAAKLRGSGVTANSVDPGPIKSGFFANMRGKEKLLLSLVLKFIAKSPAAAAKTSVYLASSADVANVTGQHFADCRPAAVSNLAQDDGLAARLWDESVALANLRNEVTLPS